MPSTKKYCRPFRTLTVLLLIGVLPNLLYSSDAGMSMPTDMPMNHDMPMDHPMTMAGMYGPYSMSREASGTSWQPDSTPLQGIDWIKDDWMFMVHGFANVGYTNQGGHRGTDQGFTTNMGMFMAQRNFDKGSVGFRGMMSLEPVMGAKGYPELLQTGETSNGQTPLIDRQHPHDLFMELALTGNHELTPNSSVFAYGGLPGEPALGPPAFMHRLSGEDNPEAPIGHHWMDSTHITYGVVTLGWTWEDVKLEGSVFRGREPDQYHWDMEEPKLDSYSGRLSYNPTRNWALQVSAGNLHSNEQLFPQYNTGRMTASAIYGFDWRDGWWQTTLGWGRNWQYSIDTLDAFLVESEVHFQNTHTVFTRIENVQKDDLVPDQPLSTISGFGLAPDIDKHPFRPPNTSNAVPTVLNIFDVSRFTLGYIYDFLHGVYTMWGVGVSGSVAVVPASLEPFYGKNPRSFLIFFRVKVGTSSHNARTEPGQLPHGEI